MSGLPITPCPRWCAGPDDHRKAVEEGCPVDELPHQSTDLGVFTHALASPYDGRAYRSEPGSARCDLIQPAALPFRSPPFIRLDVSTGGPSPRNSAQLQLTASEARSLAAILVRLADQDELPM